MKRSPLKISFISLGVILFLAATPIRTFADNNLNTILQSDTTNQGCYSLDVVFLIDQSGSMSGYGGVPASDPKDQREYAVEAVIDQLSDIALDRCPDTEHRIAVISYGTDAQVDLEFSNIDPDTFDDAEKIRELLKRDVSAKEMGQTQPKLAFQLAKEVFENLPRPESGEIRKRVIIFITDGIPYGTNQNAIEYVGEMRTQMSESYPFNSKLLKQEQCLDDLRGQYTNLEDAPEASINTCLKICPDAQCDYFGSTYIWMILLKSYQTYPQGLLDIYKDIAESHAGELIELGQNRQEIPSTFRTILSELAGVKAALLQCGKFAVNPYLRKATLNVYKLDEELSVTLSYIDSNGTKHEITQGEAGVTQGFDLAEYYAFGTNERYVLNYPYPGLWDLRADDCTGLDAYYEEVNITAGYEYLVPTELPQYDREPFYDVENPFYMEVQMLDDSGRIIEQADHQQFFVDVVMTVTMPDGTESEYGMEWVPEENIFRAKAPLEIPEPGTYSIDIVGATRRHDGEPAPISSESFSEVFPVPYELFRLEGAEFSVFPVTPFQIEILSPQDREDLGPIHRTLLQDGWHWPLLPLSINTIPVQARIIDEDGNPLLDTLDDVLATPNTALKAGIRGSSIEITLIPSPSVPGLYTGEFQDFEGEGSQRLIVNLQSEYNDHFRPLATSAETTFNRLDGPWNTSFLYLVLLVFMLLLLTIIIIRYFVVRMRPVTGTLVFQALDGATILDEINLYSGKNFTLVKGRRLRDRPDLDLRRLKALSVRTKKQQDESVDDAFTGGYAPDGIGVQRVRVDFTTLYDKQRGSIELESNMPETYSDSSAALMIYKPLDNSDRS
jgi:Mg-chelatase subunit ChlD